MDTIASFGTGLLAGLAIAVPIGAIGILLVQEGLAHGLRHGLPAAAAVAVVDTVYCSAAVLAGAVAIPVVLSLGRWPAVLGGAALMALAVVGLYRGFRRTANSRDVSVPSASRQRFMLFLGLTAVNPATLVYFAAIATSLIGLLQSGADVVLFIAGAGVGSLLWQSLLVAAGALLRGRIGPRAQRASTIIGNTAIGLFGVFILMRAA